MLRGSSRAYYGVHASAWEELRHTYYADAIQDRLLSQALPGKLLDVGCGPGFLLSKALADARFPRVTGVDFSNSMLTLLQARLDHNGHRLQLRLADARRLPFRDGTYDSVVSDMALHHLDEPGVGIREMARVARQGGRVAFADLRPHDHAWFQEDLADAWLGFAEEDVRAWMRDAGLVNVQVEDAGPLTTRFVNGAVKEAQVRAFLAWGDKA